LHADDTRLNPFSFVSDTGLRFVLLLILVVCGSIKQWFSVGLMIMNPRHKAEGCMTEKSISDLLRSDTATPADLACFRPLSFITELTFIVGGLALLALVTWLIWRCYPWRQARRLRLEPLKPAGVLEEVVAALHDLCRTAGLSPEPEFWWNPLDVRPKMALAFGPRRRRRVGLSGGLVMSHYTDPPLFRAVLLHELAHLRNRDVTLTYVALSMTWAFAATAFVPNAVITLARKPNLSDVLLTMVEVGTFALCAVLTLAAILRAREFYADVRSATWHRDSQLGAILEGAPPIPRWRRLTSTHPDPQKRARLLKSTDELFVFGTGDAFGIGVSAGIISMFSALILSPLMSPLTIGVPLLISMPFASCAIAVGVWRAAFLALMRGQTSVPLYRTAFATAAGGIVGFVTIPFFGTTMIASGFGGANPDILKLGGVGPGMILAVFLLFSVAVLLVVAVALAVNLAWIEATARYWLRATLVGKCPRSIALAVCIASAFAANVWVVAAPVISVVAAGVQPEDLVQNPLIYLWFVWAVTGSPLSSLLAWVGIAGLWALPLSATLWSRQSKIADWAFLDVAPAAVPAPLTGFARLRRAILIGMVVGLVAVLTVYLLQLPLPVGEGAPHGADALLLWLPRLIIGMLAQAVVAVLVTIDTPASALPASLLAAFVAGAVFALAEALQIGTVITPRQSIATLGSIATSFVIFGGVPLVFASVMATAPIAPRLRRTVAQ
jgi:Zn-dependent protease with chaperone function